MKKRNFTKAAMLTAVAVVGVSPVVKIANVKAEEEILEQSGEEQTTEDSITVTDESTE